MMRKLYALVARLESLLPPKRGSTGRSQLMGMYLEHANRERGIVLRASGTRERQNGRFAQNRRRGG